MKKSVEAIVDLVLKMTTMTDATKEEVIEALQAIKSEATPVYKPAPHSPKLLEGIDTLCLSPRTRNSLRSEGIRNLANLLSRSMEDIASIPRLGPAAMHDLTQCLASKGLKLSNYSTETMPSERPQAFKTVEANVYSNYLRKAGYHPNDFIYLTFEHMDEILKDNKVKPANRKKFFDWVNYSV